LQPTLLALLLVMAGVSATCAQADVVAVDRLGAAAPVLWGGGVAWQDPGGVRAATPTSPSHPLVSFRALGYTYRFALDSGSGAAGAAGSVGALAFGWEEANEMTPPMGPGDTSVPSPSLPYETSITHRGTIGADGHVTQLAACSGETVSLPFGSYEVSLAGGTVAYRCEGTPPGAQPAAGGVVPSYIALGELATPPGATRTVAEAGLFQISGDYLAYSLAGKPAGSGRVVVENWQTGTVSYEVSFSAKEAVDTLALGEDGTLVLLGAGTTACATGTARSGQTYPTEWLSPASPLAHQLGCFYDGSLRPVGGQWVALRSSGATTATASLVLLTLATGASQTLAAFPNAGVFEPQQQPLGPGADFDGHQLAWTQQTCAGTEVQFTPEVSAMSPGPPSSAQCPMLFHVPGALHPSAKGAVRVGVSCPQGCPYGELAIAQPRALRQAGAAFFSLPAATAPSVESVRLSRRERAYLRRHRRVRIALVALTGGLGSAEQARFVAHALLVR
jgi:hypothetical protein